MANDDRTHYRSFLDKVGTGAAMSEQDWLFHFEHQNTDARDGLGIGEAAPELALPDGAGRVRTRAELTGPAGLLVVFARSADW